MASESCTSTNCLTSVRGLQRQLKAAVEDYIHEGAQPTERMIRDFAACEHAYINTDHPSFIGGNKAVASVSRVDLPEAMPQAPLLDALGRLSCWKACFRLQKRLQSADHLACSACHGDS